MDRICEFCMTSRPVVYCKADSAHLCLSCDAKVHSANALSNRHTRTLVCESCRCNPAYLQCSEHKKFLCRDCDRTHHGLSTQHQKRLISSIMGCPTAKDLAALWGFDSNCFGSNTSQNVASSDVDKGQTNENITRRFSCLVEGSSLISEVDYMNSSLHAESEVGSSRENKEAYHTVQPESTSLVLQQILDLEQLQLTEGSEDTSFMSQKRQNDVLPVKNDNFWRPHKKLDQHWQRSPDVDPVHQDLCSPSEEPSAETFPFPFPQIDGEPFWQCRSPSQSNEMWLQNMQDIGVCDETECFDNLNMPDVDATFQNIEELFGGVQEMNKQLFDDRYSLCCSAGSDSSIDRSDNTHYSCSRAVEESSAASLTSGRNSAHVERDIASSSHAQRLPTIKDCPPPVRASHSTLSFSLSRLRGKSCGTDYVDTGFSPTTSRQELPCNSHDSEHAQLDNKDSLQTRYNEKKKARKSEQQARFTSPRSKSYKKNTKGRLLKLDGYESDGRNVTRSF